MTAKQWGHKDWLLPNGDLMFRTTTVEGHDYIIRGSETMFHAEHCTNHPKLPLSWNEAVLTHSR